jgi:sterol desaturase/sphingolipid hydroxylase (fatty acid hydroxylase superfamily)
VSERDFQLIRGLAVVVAIATALALQRLAPHARYRGNARTNLGLWGVNLLVVGAVCGACACTAARFAEQAGLGLFNAVQAPLWTRIVATVVALDFVSYWWHRANHVIPALWRFHAVHHSDTSFTVSTALRFHPGELLLSLPLRLAAVVAVGASPGAVVAFEAMFALSNYVEHGDIDLPTWLERRLGRAFVTPALHRLHHARKATDREHNYGTIFVTWDRLLGTHRASDSSAQVEVGLRGFDASMDLRGVLRLPVQFHSDQIGGRHR